jgi:hypothetical protein
MTANIPDHGALVVGGESIQLPMKVEVIPEVGLVEILAVVRKIQYRGRPICLEAHS